MMQAGSLQDRSIESVLTQAADEGATGGVDVHAGVRGTILLDDGHVSYAVLHAARVRSDLGATAEPSTDALESSIREVVGTLLDTTSGEWEFTSQHPMTFRVPPRHRTRYDVRRLLDDLAPTRDLGPLEAWSGTLLDALPVDGQDEFILDADMWTIVSSLIEAQSIRSIADAASLEPMRVALALARMQVRGMFRSRADLGAPAEPGPLAPPRPTNGHVVESLPDVRPAPADEHASEPADDLGTADDIGTTPVEEDVSAERDDLAPNPEPLTVPAEWTTPSAEQPATDSPAEPASSIHEALARMTVRVEEEDVEERRLRSIDLLPEALRPITIRDPEPAPPAPPAPEAEAQEDVEVQIEGRDGGSTDRRGALSRLISSLRR